MATNLAPVATSHSDMAEIGNPLYIEKVVNEFDDGSYSMICNEGIHKMFP